MGPILCFPWAQPGAQADPAQEGTKFSSRIFPGMFWLAVEDILQAC